MDQLITRVVRTVAAYCWAWLALRLTEWLGVSFDAGQTAAIQQALVIFLGAVLYAVVAKFSDKLPWLEWILIKPTPPVYMERVK